ncbi:MAG TPA: pyridoxine 5'-phosphate synthase [Gemmatimonadales bacterium]|nr:pyridoxine 5'-phosphate synthase [Gemmatimonadales bacterium]
MRLYVNVDHAATVRQARRTDEPDPVRLAVLVEQAGADGITVHLREDRRHIQDRDVELLARTVRTVVNLELAAADEIVAIAGRLKPHQATLVPERREEITTEGGLDCVAGAARLKGALTRLAAAGVRTSLFISPDPKAVAAAAALHPVAVELHTGRYAESWRTGDAALADLAAAARQARGLGLAVHAGHGLTYENVGPVAALRDVEELNIGHSIISRAVFVGIERAVREMRERIDRARAAS